MWRLWTPAEIDLLAHAWGPSTVWYHVPTGVYVGSPSRVEFDDENPYSPTMVYIAPDAAPATKVHEAGHAIHVNKYPDSRKWSTLKCETFAMLGVVRAGLDEVYGDLPEVLAARRIVAAQPLRYDLMMKMAAEMDV